MLFGVSDEIMNMSRSLEMVERSRFIYRTIVFGHQKCFGVTRYLSGHRKGFRAPPTKDMGLMGQEGKHTSHKGLVRSHMGLPNRRRKGGKGKERVE